MNIEPQRLIILGDLVHDKTAAPEAARLLQTLAAHCEPIVVAGNHDRQLRGKVEMVESWETDRFYFHHGHCATDRGHRIQIIGHHHPAGVITDGAGLRLKCPAFVQQSTLLDHAGVFSLGERHSLDGGRARRMWLCTAERVLPLPDSEAA